MSKRNLILLGIFIIIVGGIVHWGWEIGPKQDSTPTQRPPQYVYQFAPGGQTPGEVDPACTKALVCQPGYSKSVRHLSAETKHIADAKAGPVINSKCEHMLCQYDHLVSIELCGAPDSPKNVWRQTFPEYKFKDRIENQLHAEVCADKISLPAAQDRIKLFWKENK